MPLIVYDRTVEFKQNLRQSVISSEEEMISLNYSMQAHKFLGIMFITSGPQDFSFISLRFKNGLLTDGLVYLAVYVYLASYTAVICWLLFLNTYTWTIRISWVTVLFSLTIEKLSESGLRKCDKFGQLQ